MSIVLVLTGLLILLAGLPWLAAAVGLLLFGLSAIAKIVYARVAPPPSAP